MKLRNTKSLICFAIISSLFLGCTVVSEPETTQTIDQSSTSAVEAPPAANAAAPSTDKDDPAAATKTVEVKAGEPLLDVKASGGYFTGGILTKNGLSEADLGSVLTNPANAGVIGTRCSVSIPMKAMSDALMDRLDGGTATDTSALRGSANFFGVGCIGTPDYRVAKTGTLIVPDHGRKELGAQLAGTKSNLARLGEEVGAQGTKIDKLIRALETNNARIAKLSDDAKVEEKKAAEAWGKIYAGMAFLLITSFLLSIVYVLYRRR
ncbi:hypothetical protein KBD18_02495, partial [Patescibacteria group bacterium]|nr:hypothetical protein [Patescibacteria group bacterium]